MNIRLFLMAVLIAVCLSACATAKRGAKQMFMVETMPPGARVETTLVDGRAPKLTQAEFDKITSGEIPTPKLVFKSCEPTPCGFEISRKREFDILVSKDGYASQTHTIDHFHRKEIAKQIEREVALSTVVVGTGAAALGASVVAAGTSLASFGTMTASTGAMAAGAAVMAAPVAGIALLSVGVDSSTGANYDYWPNPAALVLEETTVSRETERDTVFQLFDEERRAAIIRPYPSRAEMRYEKEQVAKARKQRLENDRLFKDYVASAPADPPGKPQHKRHERRLEKQRQRDAEREKNELDIIED